MPKPPATAPEIRFNPRIALAGIAGLLILFAALAYFAVSSKAPTYDEPLHALSAWQSLWGHDFRVNPEDPPLWKYWAALGNGPSAIHADTHSDVFAEVAAFSPEHDQWYYVVETLFRTEGNDGDTFIMHSRQMMLVVGVGLGVAIAWWAWQLGGAFAALVATIFFALDPNMLAHAPLVKNDISLSLVMLGLAWAIWRAGQRVTIRNALAICLVCAAAVTVKFSGLLLGPIAAVMLITRAILPEPWRVLRWTFATRLQRLCAAGVLCVSAIVVSYIAIWACYGFRYNATPDPSVQLGFDRLRHYTAEGAIKATGHVPTEQEIDAWQPTLAPRVMLSLNAAHVLPQAWVAGLLYTYQSALYRPTYLLGDHSITGWWYYFPMAMLFKSPLTLLLSCACAAGIGYGAFRRRVQTSGRSTAMIWTSFCLAIPSALYLLAAMGSNLNIGLRHVLPLYPFIYISLALAAVHLHKQAGAATKRAVAVIVLALGAEALVAFPGYIAFFNIACGGTANGINLLGDSNLDWGQDLKELAKWRQQHPGGRLYLLYFGLADPWAYGIDGYVNIQGGYKFGPQPLPPEQSQQPGLLAASATMLQGIYVDPSFRKYYSTIRKQHPIGLVGQTIYLYKWPLDLPAE